MKLDPGFWAIYVYHTLSRWGTRVWGFSVGLYIVILYPGSLMVAAILGMSLSLVVIIFGSAMGNIIDRNERLIVTLTSLFVGNGFVILGSALLAFNLLYKDNIHEIWPGLQTIFFVGIIMCSMLNALGGMASDIVIEKDWIVVLSKGNQKQLSQLNSTMRTIDLTTYILAPVAMGQILTFASPFVGSVFIGSWSAISLAVQYFLLRHVYQSVPQLSQKKPKPDADSERKPFWNISVTLDAWKLYFNHTIRFAGFGLALLYMTVLSFDSVTFGYIYGQGGSASFIGIVTAAGAVTGILGCTAFPFLKSKFGDNVTGNIGFGVNVLALLFCVGSIFGPGSPFELTALLEPFQSNTNHSHYVKTYGQLWVENSNVFYFVGGIIFARFGLWVGDLSVTQMMQENVGESERGVINGVQAGLNQIFELLKFILVVMIPSIQGFGALIVLTWIAMLLAWVCFLIHGQIVKRQTVN